MNASAISGAGCVPFISPSLRIMPVHTKKGSSEGITLSRQSAKPARAASAASLLRAISAPHISTHIKNTIFLLMLYTMSNGTVIGLIIQ